MPGAALPARERVGRSSLRREPRRRASGLDPRLARLALALLLAVAVGLVTLGTTRDGSTLGSVALSGPIPPKSLLPSGPPRKELLATQAGVKLYVPVEQDLITAIAYHPVAESRAYALEPAGRQANAGVLRRLWRRVFGDDSSALRYYVSDGSTDAVGVGAHAGTFVYSPVRGQIVSIVPEVINGRAYGSTVGIQPTDNPTVVVNVSHLALPLQPDGSTRLRIGDQVQPAETLLGSVADLARVQTSDVRQYVSDSGNNAMIEVDQAPAQALP